MKNLLKRLLKRKSMRMVIVFTKEADGTITTELKMNRKIPVSYAITTLSRITFDLKAKLTNKVQLAGLDSRNSKTRGFIRGTVLGDIL